MRRGGSYGNARGGLAAVYPLGYCHREVVKEPAEVSSGHSDFAQAERRAKPKTQEPGQQISMRIRHAEVYVRVALFLQLSPDPTSR